MTGMGEICLLAAFVGVGYAAFTCLYGARWQRPALLRTGIASGVAGLLALTIVMAILAKALLEKDFSLQYVAQYSSQNLPWYYSLSALWVGQAGSLLLWAWLLGIVALLFRIWPWKRRSALRDPAFGILMAYCCFLIATMVFAADPMEVNIAPGKEGAGLSPLLQHPAMLIHPPVIFLGYAVWAIPCALAIAALAFRRTPGDKDLNGLVQKHELPRQQMPIDASWIGIARPWALAAWTVLGGGILLGAYWSYEELGWGGYWAWDPVENGSLIPWLIGSAYIHTMMTWQFRGMLKKTSIALAIATFAMCNFATFLTRSGIFSSLHAFSQSPIGWLFLGLMLVLGVVGFVLIVGNRYRLVPDNAWNSLWARESFVLISLVALLLLAGVMVAGTLCVALSDALTGRRIMVGPGFYDYVLIPTGLVLLATLAGAPLLRWGAPPAAQQQKALLVSAVAASLLMSVIWISGVWHPLALLVAWLTAFSVATLVAFIVLESAGRKTNRTWRGLISALATSRRSWAGFVIHMGFVSIAAGVTGSSLGSQRHEFVMHKGEAIQWAGRSVCFQRLIERELSDKFIVEAELKIVPEGEKPFLLLPSQHFHRLQSQWTTEVAIHSTWRSDFYTILQNSEDRAAVRVTLVENPMMRWMWFGGCVIAVGALLRLWPSRRRTASLTPPPIQNILARNASGHRKRRRELAAAKS